MSSSIWSVIEESPYILQILNNVGGPFSEKILKWDNMLDNVMSKTSHILKLKKHRFNRSS